MRSEARSFSTFAIAAAYLAALLGSALGQERELLRICEDSLAGKTLTVQIDIEQRQRLEFGGQEIRGESQFRLGLSRVLARSAKGIEVVSRIHEIAGRFGSRGEWVEYDSKSKTQDAAAAEAFAFLLDSRTVHVLDARGEIVDFQSQGFGAQQGMAETLRMLWLRLPQDSLAVGDTWKETFKVAISPGESDIETAIEWRLVRLPEPSESPRVAVIEGALTMSAPPAGALQILASKGRLTVEFDLDRGLPRLIESQSRIEALSFGVKQTLEQDRRERVIQLEP